MESEVKMNLVRTKTIRILGVIALMLATSLAAISVSEMYVRSQVPVSLYGHSIFVDLWDDGYVALEGTWVMENEKHAYPLNTSTIVCRVRTKECTDSSAKIHAGSTPLLKATEDVHEITSWNKDTLIYQTSALCVDYVYTVSRATKQVSGIRKAKSGANPSCSDQRPEIKLRLTNGWDTYWQMEKDARPVAVNVAGLILILGLGGFWMRKIVKEPVLSKT